MKNALLINEASKAVETTSETLRYYDRIGLVKPYKGKNGYRYYSYEQVVILKVIKRLQDLGFSLKEVSGILKSDSLDELMGDLDEAIRRCDSAIKKLNDIKKTLHKAKEQYSRQQREPVFLKEIDYPDRHILLSENANVDNIENLYDYQFLYRNELGEKFSNYSFKDQAGLFEKDGRTSLFIELNGVPSEQNENIIKLNEGKYLVSDCKKGELEAKLSVMKELAFEKYGFTPKETIVLIVVNGILTWSYRVQIRIK